MKSSTISILLLCFCAVVLSDSDKKSPPTGTGISDTTEEKSSSKADFDSDESFVDAENMRDCICNRDIFKPICGTDGKTYKSKCIFKCFKKKNSSLRLKYKKPCIKDDIEVEETTKPDKGLLETNVKTSNLLKNKSKMSGCGCSDQYRPVCGSDGKTYDNECLMKCLSKKQNIRIRYSGQCEADRILGNGGQGLVGTKLLTGLLT